GPVGALGNWTDVWEDNKGDGGESAKEARKFLRQAEAMREKVKKGLGMERKGLAKDLEVGDVVLTAYHGFQPITAVAPSGKYDVRVSFESGRDKAFSTHEYVDVLPAERQENPTPQEMLADHERTWKNVRWDTLEFDEEDAAEMPYTFSVRVPCYVPDDMEDDKAAERRIESAVRHFFAREVTRPTGQRVLPGIQLRPAGVPGVGIHVGLDGYTEVEVTMAFDQDVSDQTLRTIVSLLD
ncbi:unnamed protein product, partial [marine sediment metagenome]